MGNSRGVVVVLHMREEGGSSYVLRIEPVILCMGLKQQKQHIQSWQQIWEYERRKRVHPDFEQRRCNGVYIDSTEYYFSLARTKSSPVFYGVTLNLTCQELSSQRDHRHNCLVTVQLGYGHAAPDEICRLTRPTRDFAMDLAVFHFHCSETQDP